MKEAMDGRAEVERVEDAIREAEEHHKRLEFGEALEKTEEALRLAHRAKAAMKLKVGVRSRSLEGGPSFMFFSFYLLGRGVMMVLVDFLILWMKCPIWSHLSLFAGLMMMMMMMLSWCV